MFDLKNEELIYVKKDDIEYIQFKKLLDYGIKHAYTLKSNNIDFSFNQELNSSSYKKLCKALEIDVNKVVQPIQTHTDCVKCIDTVISSEQLHDVDGLITDKKNIALTSKNADCILFLFYDPVKKVIANVHSGWRGTFQRIAEKAVEKMISNYGSKVQDILCFISPSIRQDHFEVGEDVKEICEDIFKFTGKTKEFIKKDKKYYIDTVLINKILLLNLGLKENNIIDSALCSVCNKDKIESVRVDKEQAGRATAIIVL